jgi:hypothetical protein
MRKCPYLLGSSRKVFVKNEGGFRRSSSGLNLKQRCSGLCCSSTIASIFPGSLPQRLRLRRDSERLRFCPQSEAVLRGPQALRRALAVWYELTSCPSRSCQVSALILQAENHCRLCVRGTRHAEVVWFSCTAPDATPSFAVFGRRALSRLSVARFCCLDYSLDPSPSFFQARWLLLTSSSTHRRGSGRC